MSVLIRILRVAHVRLVLLPLPDPHPPHDTYPAKIEKSPPKLVVSVKSAGTRRYKSMPLAPERCVAMAQNEVRVCGCVGVRRLEGR